LTLSHQINVTPVNNAGGIEGESMAGEDPCATLHSIKNTIKRIKSY